MFKTKPVTYWYMILIIKIQQLFKFELIWWENVILIPKVFGLDRFYSLSFIT